MYQQRQYYNREQMVGGEFNDTTYTKIFVGGLAWETKRDTMRQYFEQFGQILEAVVITDKYSGRSKGYGFVTFKDADSAMRACQNPCPVIDGRRANCNLASLGAHNTNPTSSHQYGIGRYRPAPEFVAPPAYYGSSSSSSSSVYYPQYTLPYSAAAYGYNNAGYPQDTIYPMNYMSSPMYGGQHYSPYYYNTITTPTGGGVYPNLYQPPPTTSLVYSNEYPQQQPHHSTYGVHHYPQMFHYPPPPYFHSNIPSSSVPPISTMTTSSPDSTIEARETQNTAGVAAAMAQAAAAPTSQADTTINTMN